MARWMIVAAVVFATTAAADEVYLRSGGKVSGVVVDRTETLITLEVGPGRISLPMSSVADVRSERSALAVYRERAARLAPDNLGGWLELAFWARECRLETQALEAFDRVLQLDPDDARARAALGQVRHGGRWLTHEQSQRARGLVLFEGEWITPAERAHILGERAQVASAARARAEARIREAEARAREAEAEARRAELAARQTESGGIPYEYVWLGGGRPNLGGYGKTTCPRCRNGGQRPSTPAPPPRARVAPRKGAMGDQVASTSRRGVDRSRRTQRR